MACEANCTFGSCLETSKESICVCWFGIVGEKCDTLAYFSSPVNYTLLAVVSLVVFPILYFIFARAIARQLEMKKNLEIWVLDPSLAFKFQEESSKNKSVLLHSSHSVSSHTWSREAVCVKGVPIQGASMQEASNTYSQAIHDPGYLKNAQELSLPNIPGLEDFTEKQAKKLTQKKIHDTNEPEKDVESQILPNKAPNGIFGLRFMVAQLAAAFCLIRLKPYQSVIYPSHSDPQPVSKLDSKASKQLQNTNTDDIKENKEQKLFDQQEIYSPILDLPISEGNWSQNGVCPASSLLGGSGIELELDVSAKSSNSSEFINQDRKYLLEDTKSERMHRLGDSSVSAPAHTYTEEKEDVELKIQSSITFAYPQLFSAESSGSLPSGSSDSVKDSFFGCSSFEVPIDLLLSMQHPDCSMFDMLLSLPPATNASIEELRKSSEASSCIPIPEIKDARECAPQLLYTLLDETNNNQEISDVSPTPSPVHSLDRTRTASHNYLAGFSNLIQELASVPLAAPCLKHPKENGVDSNQDQKQNEVSKESAISTATFAPACSATMAMKPQAVSFSPNVVFDSAHPRPNALATEFAHPTTLLASSNLSGHSRSQTPQVSHKLKVLKELKQARICTFLCCVLTCISLVVESIHSFFHPKEYTEASNYIEMSQKYSKYSLEKSIVRVFPISFFLLSLAMSMFYWKVVQSRLISQDHTAISFFRLSLWISTPIVVFVTIQLFESKPITQSAQDTVVQMEITIFGNFGFLLLMLFLVLLNLQKTSKTNPGEYITEVTPVPTAVLLLKKIALSMLLFILIVIVQIYSVVHDNKPYKNNFSIQITLEWLFRANVAFSLVQIHHLLKPNSQLPL